MKTYGKNKRPHPTCAELQHLTIPRLPSGNKTRLMIARPHITVLVALIFMVLVGCSLAYAIQSQSVTGLILSVISLTAGIYCLHLVVKARQQIEREKEETA